VDHIDKRQGNLEQRVAALRAAESRGQDATKRAVKSAPKKERAAKPAADSAGKYHVVSAGETRYGIARRYGLSVKQLDRINGFSADTVIQPGQKILVQK
jgi:LysM repeat protein